MVRGKTCSNLMKVGCMCVVEISKDSLIYFVIHILLLCIVYCVLCIVDTVVWYVAVRCSSSAIIIFVVVGWIVVVVVVVVVLVVVAVASVLSMQLPFL